MVQVQGDDMEIRKPGATRNGCPQGVLRKAKTSQS